MGLPKNYNNNLQIQNTSKLKGDARKQELKKMITDNDTNLPKGVEHRDLDLGFKNFIKENLYTVVNGEKVPTIMTGIDRWNLFLQTWNVNDVYGNIKIPFININREPDTQFGSNPSLKYTVPQGNTYYYGEIPIWNNDRKGVDIYKIPQPVPIDIYYNVKIFAYKQSTLNTFNKNVMNQFQSRQAYTLVNGHYIPIVLENTGDESQWDLENKRFYIQTYRFNLQGFFIDPSKFKVIPAINRTKTTISVNTENKTSTKNIGSQKNFTYKSSIEDILKYTSNDKIVEALKNLNKDQEIKNKL